MTWTIHSNISRKRSSLRNNCGSSLRFPLANLKCSHLTSAIYPANDWQIAVNFVFRDDTLPA